MRCIQQCKQNDLRWSGSSATLVGRGHYEAENIRFSSTRFFLINVDPGPCKEEEGRGVADAHPGVRDDEMVETEEVAGVEDVEVAVTTRQRWSGSSRSWPPFSP
jgi:hypothetical protein